MTLHFTKPVALVTGASRGIGRAIALRLAKEGYAVAVNYVRSHEKAAEVVDELEAGGRSAVAIQADVGNGDDRQRLVKETLAKFGRLDVLVNNAGITSPGRRDILDATEEGWDTVFATNLKGPFFLAKAAANEMLRLIEAKVMERGTIVNISSISALAVSVNRADYCIAKSALQMMTWLYADRLAPHNINVFEVCPGIIASDMTEPVKQKYDELIAGGLTPIRRWGQPEDVAATVAALVRGDIPFCTGERIHVDGGFHIRRL
ncbi:MAG: 3-ketoacyl-ACP reductase [Pirellulaceae bacterium]|nr:3-ketoacyl-ACP reductase [Pirellulaceae bacterium]